MSNIKAKRIGFLGDLHSPFFNCNFITWAREVFDANDVEIVIQGGDLTEQRMWNRFAKSPHDENAALEWETTEEAVAYLHEVFPEMILIIGNHDGRIMKKAFEAGIPRQLIRDLNDVFDYPGWKWHLGPKPLILNGKTAVIHGDEIVGHVGLKASKMGLNVVQFHTHQGRLEFIPVLNKMLYGMEAGCGVDITASCFGYAAKNPRGIWLGVGMELDGDPYLLTYPGDDV